MKERKTETILYDGLGFPIQLIDVPMKKAAGIWVIDIDMNEFQLVVMNRLIRKPYRLTGKELKFMRKFFNMSPLEFGKNLGVSSITVTKWEKGQTKISPTQEIYIRMFLLSCLKNRELLEIFDEIKPEKLAETDNKKAPVFSIDVKEIKIAI